MKINFCCPTRSKPDILEDFLLETVRNCRLPDTQVVVGIDADEEPLYERFFPHPRLIKSVAPREDSLGAKFNRCAAALDADIYVMGVDDLGIALPGWDYTVAELAKLFNDGIGMVTFGQQWNEPGLPAFQCVTRRFVELNGFFMAPYFPYWWHDTWSLELGELTGRMIHFPADIRYPDKAPPWARRDLVFWANFFDHTRALRCEAADRILQASDEAPWRRYDLLARRPAVMEFGRERNAKLRDPRFAARHEGGELVDQHPERHERLKAAATALLDLRDAA